MLLRWIVRIYIMRKRSLKSSFGSIILTKAMKQRTFKTNIQTLWHSIECLAPEHRKILWSCFWQYEHFVNHLIKIRGLKSTIKILKEIHLVSKGVSMGIRRRHIPYKEMWMRTTSSGIPRKLNKLHLLLISRHSILRRCALSVSAAYVLYKTEVDYSVKSILDPYKGSYISDTEVESSPYYGTLPVGDKFIKEPRYLVKLLVSFIKWFIPKWIKPPLNPFKCRHIFTGFRGGPYGSPSFRFSPLDAKILMSEQYSGLLKSCLSFAKVYGGQYYQEYWLREVLAAKDFYETFCSQQSRYYSKGFKHPKGPDRVAKISFLSEKGGKTRIITAANFWIQKLLFPFHHEMMNCLGKIPTDYSFDQERCGATLTDLLKTVRCAFSYDMSGATDRFPRWLQKLILNCFRDRLGDYWEEIMTLPVYVKIDPGENRDANLVQGGYLEFECGQPMGIYSSWPVFAYSHHVLLRFCVWMRGLDPFTFLYYLLLGDDIAILQRRVARCYHYVLTVVLGVDVSIAKSYTFPFSFRPGVEFAKRNFVGGLEVSPLSPTMLLSLIEGKDPSLFRTLLERIIKRWRLSLNRSQSSFVCELSKRVLPFRRRNSVMKWLLSPDVLPDCLAITDRIKEIRDEWYPPYPSTKVIFESVKVAHYNKLISLARDSLKEKSPQSLLAWHYNVPKEAIVSLSRDPVKFGSHHPLPTTTLGGTPLHDPPINALIVYKEPELGPYHPLLAVIQRIFVQLDELSQAYQGRSGVYRILTLLKHYESFFKGRIVSGNFYSQTNKMEVLTSFALANKVKETSRRMANAWPFSMLSGESYERWRNG